MILQNVVDISMPEGNVDIIRDKNNILLWGRRRYGTKYFGDTLQNGTPTPEEPVAIQTVTGTQTVTINGTNYPISLGSIELCKLGTYQDYIWKDGDDWKVHKETNSITYDGTNYGFSSRPGTSVSGKYRFLLEGSAAEKSIGEPSSSAYFTGVCNMLISGTRNNTYMASGNVVAPRAENGYGNVGVVYTDAIAGMTYEQANTWLTTHNMTVKYALATPTDTTITDSALISQLNAVENFITRSGYTYSISGDLPIIISRTEI